MSLLGGARLREKNRGESWCIGTEERGIGNRELWTLVGHETSCLVSLSLAICDPIRPLELWTLIGHETSNKRVVIHKSFSYPTPERSTFFERFSDCSEMSFFGWGGWKRFYAQGICRPFSCFEGDSSASFLNRRGLASILSV